MVNIGAPGPCFRWHSTMGLISCFGLCPPTSSARVPWGVEHLAAISFAKNQICWPLWARVHSALGSRRNRNNGFEGVDTGVKHLRAQCALRAPPIYQHGRAVHQCPQGEHESGMGTRRSTQAPSQTMAKEVERRPGFMQGRRLGNSVEQYSIRFTVPKGELQVSLAGLRQGAGEADFMEEFLAGLQAQGAENVLAVAEALIHGGGGRAGGFGHRAHGERFLAASGPQS